MRSREFPRDARPSWWNSSRNNKPHCRPWQPQWPADRCHWSRRRARRVNRLVRSYTCRTRAHPRRTSASSSSSTIKRSTRRQAVSRVLERPRRCHRTTNVSVYPCRRVNATINRRRRPHRRRRPQTRLRSSTRLCQASTRWIPSFRSVSSWQLKRSRPLLTLLLVPLKHLWPLRLFLTLNNKAPRLPRRSPARRLLLQIWSLLLKANPQRFHNR